MANVLDLVSWALAADVQSDAERRIGRWPIKAVLAALATHTNAETAETFVSAARIGADVDLAERKVRDALAALEAQGLITVDRDRKPHRRRLSVPTEKFGSRTSRPSAGIRADDQFRTDARGVRTDACGPDPHGDPHGDPHASVHLSDPIKSSSSAREGEQTMRNDPNAEQLARVADVLDVTDPAVIVDAWARHRPELRNPLAVVARMPDVEIRKELGRYKPTATPPPCPDCHGEGWLYTETDNGIDAVKCTHPRKEAA